MHKSTCHDNLKNELLSADFQTRSRTEGSTIIQLAQNPKTDSIAKLRNFFNVILYSPALTWHIKYKIIKTTSITKNT